MQPFMVGWFSEYRVDAYVSVWIPHTSLFGCRQNTALYQSLSNMTCKLFMIKGENFGTLYSKLCEQVQTTVFAKSLTNFTHKLLMITGGTLLILVLVVKHQGQL